MPEHQARRRAEFEEGISVRLADGGRWTLPARGRPAEDPDLLGLLKCATEAEDRAELLQIELAITVLLLRRNYDLAPEQVESLLCFPPGDPALDDLRDDVHKLVIRSIDRHTPAAGED